jgi:hypothetical protein
MGPERSSLSKHEQLQEVQLRASFIVAELEQMHRKGALDRQHSVAWIERATKKKQNIASKSLEIKRTWRDDSTEMECVVYQLYKLIFGPQSTCQ